MQGFKDLIASERGFFCLAALVIAALLVVIGKLTGEMWLDFIKYLTGVLVMSKTVTTAVETVTLKKAQIEPPTIPEARVVKERASSPEIP